RRLLCGDGTGTRFGPGRCNRRVTFMGRPTTAREALLAELLGDIAVLLDRVDALPPEVHQATQTLSKAADRAAQTVVLVDGQLAALAKQAKVAAMQHVAKETHALFDRIAQEQRALMT
ncbi:hypothetical protein, partial [Aquincola tertiaricarbonis]|uniref:hypothetical protein n=1 Tax=Aquincola tertiaricarbonis TaxID=391953 RepID=UPI001E43BBEC